MADPSPPQAANHDVNKTSVIYQVQHRRLQANTIGLFSIPVDNLTHHPRQRKPSDKQVMVVKELIEVSGGPLPQYYLTAFISPDSSIPENSQLEDNRVLLDVKAEVIMGGHRKEAITQYYDEKGKTLPGERTCLVMLLSRSKAYRLYIITLK